MEQITTGSQIFDKEKRPTFLMKIWIVYDSKFGNNKRVAEYMKQKLGSSNEVFVEYAKKVNPKQVVEDRPDILLIGGPIRAGKLSRTIRNWAQKFGGIAKKTGLDLKKLGVWETKFRITEALLQKNRTFFGDLKQQNDNPGPRLKALSDNIHAQHKIEEILSLEVVGPEGPDGGNFKDTVLESGFEQKIDQYLIHIQ